MRKIRLFNSAMVSFAIFLTGYSANSQSMLDFFPEECANATDREPLPGHFLRVGFVASTNVGFSFFFPDQRMGQNLQMVQVADNVGLIGFGGVNPGEIQFRTPPGSFVVGQIFVGDSQGEPIVTCLSRPILLTQFVPRYYGFDNSWLDRSSFGNYLGYKKYSRWKWRDRWQRDIYNTRSKFTQYWDKNRTRFDRKYKNRNWRERTDRKDWNRDSRRDDRGDQNRGRGGWRKGVSPSPNLGRDAKPDDDATLKPNRRKGKWTSGNQGQRGSSMNQALIQNQGRTGASTSQERIERNQGRRGASINQAQIQRNQGRAGTSMNQARVQRNQGRGGASMNQAQIQRNQGQQRKVQSQSIQARKQRAKNPQQPRVNVRTQNSMLEQEEE